MGASQTNGRSMSLPLYPGAQPCVGSGMCCKRGPCDFGERTSAEDPACRYLEQTSVEGPPRYTCGRYDFIITQPGWQMNPAFGAGCCMPMFNDARQAILDYEERTR